MWLDHEELLMIVITGATGFIGSALLWELNQGGHEDILISDHIPPSERSQVFSKLSFKKFVLANDLLEYLKALKNPPEYIFHMGACSSTTEKDVIYLKKNNTLFTEDLFEYCAKNEVPFIYASSGAVYGNGDHGFDDESPPTLFSPLNPYGWSKLNFDLLALKKDQRPPQWYGLRFFNVFGPNEYHKGNMASVAYKAFLQIRENGELNLFKSHNPLYPDGGQLRDFIYIKDITKWMVEIMNRKGKVGSGIYNMGFGKARTWLDLASSVFHALDRPMKINWIPVPEDIRAQYQYFTEAKLDKLLSASLPSPEWSLEDGIFDYVTKYLQRPDPYL